MLAVGTEAPDFASRDQDGHPFRLADHRGEWVVLYFYPKDETTGCIAEACSFRDSLGEMASLQAKVVGVSTDSVASHKAFAEHHGLTFTLVADEEKLVSRQYEALGMLGVNRRMTYVIDPEGRIVDAYRSEVRPGSHVERVRQVLRERQG